MCLTCYHVVNPVQMIRVQKKAFQCLRILYYVINTRHLQKKPQKIKTQRCLLFTVIKL